jgi:hypothetical protein
VAASAFLKTFRIHSAHCDGGGLQAQYSGAAFLRKAPAAENTHPQKNRHFLVFHPSLLLYYHKNPPPVRGGAGFNG